MSRDTIVTLYHYDELGDRAKEKARDWFRQCDAGETGFADSITDDFHEVAKACGLDVDGLNPNNLSDKGLYWSGFSSQGDGASFTASWSASRVDVAAILADRPATYTDRETGKTETCKGNAELAEVLKGFAELADSDRTASGGTIGSYRGHCQTDTAYDTDTDCGADFDTVLSQRSRVLKELCENLAHWFYRSLEREYDYTQSDETVADNIIANEYEFTVEGVRRHDR